MNRKRYEHLKKLAEKEEAIKLNVHSVFLQKKATLKCPKCGQRFALKLEIHERSSAVFLRPIEE